jgi:hypothetical protein
VKSWTKAVLVSGAVLLSMEACTSVGKMPHDMETVIQSATTKADHEALAAHYEQEAKALQDKATEHERMAQAYTKSVYPRMKTSLAQHCATIATKYREAAKENRELAREHHELAAEAPK